MVLMATRLAVLAYAMFACALALAVVAIGGAFLLGFDSETAWSSYLVTNTAIGLSAAPCGLLIARAKAANPIGWLFLVAALAHLLTAAMAPLLVWGIGQGWPESALRLVVTISLFSWSWGVFCCFPLVVQLFPSGTPVSPRWRVLCWLTVGNAVLGNIFVGPTPEMGASSFLVAPWWPVTESIASVLAPLLVLASIASIVVRYVRGGDAVREQLLWLAVAVVLVVVLNAPSWIALPTGQTILLLLSFPLIPAAVTIAVLRYGLFDVRVVVSRLVVYVLLTAGVIAAYAGLVAVLDRLLQGAGAPALAALAVALAFNPVRVQVQRAVDRAVYGARRDPVAAVSAVGRRLKGDDLAGVVDALRDALGSATWPSNDRTPAPSRAAHRRRSPRRGRSRTTTDPSAPWWWAPDRASAACLGRMTRCSISWPPRSLSQSMRRHSPKTWKPPANGSSRLRRTNGNGCAVSCTTASGRSSPVLPSRQTGLPSLPAAAPTGRSRSRWNSPTSSAGQSTRFGAWPTGCAPRTSTSSAW